MTLTIPHALFSQLREHGETTYPLECCGVLVGEFDATGSKTVDQVVPCQNTHTASPANRYQIDPVELVRIQRDAMLSGRDIVGFYHSHPDHPARWSATDLAEAHWVGCSYVIASIENGHAVFTNSFQLLGPEENKHFEDEQLHVIERD